MSILVEGGVPGEARTKGRIAEGTAEASATFPGRSG